MKKWILGLLALLLILPLAAYLSLRQPAPPERQVFINGKILTMDAENSIVSAIALERDRIVAVGDRHTVKGYMDNAHIVDLAGKVMIPGIIDAHGHFPFSGAREVIADLNSPPIGTVSSIADIQSILGAKIKEAPSRKWIVGSGYDDTLIKEMRHPTREELDAVSRDHAIVIVHISGHLTVANSLALELVGIDASTPNPQGGVIVKDPDTGELTGLLEENAATSTQTAAMSAMMGFNEVVSIFNTAVHDYASMGVTTAQAGGVPDTGTLKLLGLMGKWGLIPVRLELWPFFHITGEQILSGELDLSPYNSDRVQTQTVKIVADGSIQGFTGYLSHPYHTPYRGDEEYRGYPTFPRDDLAEIVTRLHTNGFRIAIHTNGDAAIDDAIYAFDKAQAAHPVEDPRLILVHSQMARDDQLDEMKRLNMTPSFFSAHTYYWGDRHRDIFMGPERAMRMSPATSALNRDLMFTVHLDAPIVPMEPMLLLWSAVNRLSTSGEVIGEEQRISAMDALRATTINAAWQIFREDELGSIEVGKLADLAILDGDPLGDPLKIRDIGILRTIVGGTTIYQQ